MSPLSVCLRLLKHRLRSRWELEQALQKREIKAEEIEATLQQLEEIGLINDLGYARAWLHTRDALSPRGDFLLRFELKQKGIAAEIIEKALAERKEQAGQEEEMQLSEVELARQLVERKERIYASLAPEVRKRRLAALLGRRGFSSEVIHRILSA